MKQINWLNHGLEFLVVLIGILLAFQLNKCASDNKNQKLVGEHISSIIDETQGNQKRLVLAIEQAEKNIILLDTTLTLIQEERDFSQINENAMQLLTIGGFYPFENAYRTLVQSGDIRLIKDYDLKNRLINTYEYYGWVKSFDEVNLQTFNQYYFPYLMEHFDIMNYQPVDDKVYLERKFANTVASYRYLLGMRLEKYRDLQQHLTKLEAFLSNI